MRLRGSDWMSSASTSSPKSAGRPRREHGCRARARPIRIILPAPAVLVDGEQAPGAGAQEGLRLAERLDVRVDALDGLERRPAAPRGTAGPAR